MSSDEWWLDGSELPTRRIWARLSVTDDQTAQVLDCDRKVHRFQDREAAVEWLREDEYSPLTDLIDDGDLPPGSVAPKW